MPVALTAADVEAFTGQTVTADQISLAASLISDQTAYTVDEHVDDRAIPELSVRAAWAMVAVRVARFMSDDHALAVASETQGDYTYSESVTISKSTKFSTVCDGRPSELLQLRRARWEHR